MVNLPNQKILRIQNKNVKSEQPAFITEDVVEVRRAKLIYYKWISRLMAVLATLSLLYGVCATLAILKLIPNIMFDPQIFVELSDSSSLVKREYINRRMESREKIMVNFIKQYVELRNTYIKDDAEMKKRWLWGGLVSYLSTYEVYKKFEKQFPKVIEELRENQASRSVEILSVTRSGGEQSFIWKVEFKTYDYSYNINSQVVSETKPNVVERYWTVNIRCQTDEYRRTAYRRLLNPLGFVVTDYFQSEIEN
ncbi:MAG: type IV secretion system protein [Alphaproteobacteria bacterium]|nr:type IV secretion system protein [Alphaproteobacteria bacterium]